MGKNNEQNNEIHFKNELQKLKNQEVKGQEYLTIFIRILKSAMISHTYEPSVSLSIKNIDVKSFKRLNKIFSQCACYIQRVLKNKTNKQLNELTSSKHIVVEECQWA